MKATAKKTRRTKKFEKIKVEAVRNAVKWLWSNRNNGGCYYFPCWVEPEWMKDVSPTDYNLVPNPHAGREWCVVIGWHDIGDKEEYPELYQDDHWVIQAGIRYQDRNNGMQCDYDIDWTMPYPCNEYGDVYDLSIDIPRKPRGGFRAITKELNEYVAEMYEFWEKHGKELE